MDIPNKKLTENQKQFFDNLSIFINKPVYFYGSINRPDYIPGKSDIDIDIFADNENSTTQLLSNFLNLKKNEIKKTVLKINSEVVYGHKLQYEDNANGINVEMSIYNENYKQLVLNDHNKNKYLPIYITIPLVIIKFMFYTLNMISKKSFKRCKQYLMNTDDEMKFIELIN